MIGYMARKICEKQNLTKEKARRKNKDFLVKMETDEDCDKGKGQIQKLKIPTKKKYSNR